MRKTPAPGRRNSTSTSTHIGEDDKTNYHSALYMEGPATEDEKRGVSHPQVNSNITKHKSRLKEQNPHPALAISNKFLLGAASESMARRRLFT
ncbi:hypothetical protein F66182_2431 [Fusarium sp. NRRL 66182]|nr:hypothetical protein F66182_2431 [Fusarium sp. NRRL 66182]